MKNMKTKLILLLLFFANQSILAQMKKQDIFIIEDKIPLFSDSIKPIKQFSIKVGMTSKDIELIIEEAKDSVLYYRGNTLKVDSIGANTILISKGKLIFLDRFKGSVFNFSIAEKEVQLKFKNDFIILQKIALKLADSLDFYHFKRHEPLRIAYGAGYMPFKVVNFGNNKKNTGNYWEANFHIVKNYHPPAYYQFGCLTGIGLIFSTSTYISERPVKTLGFPYDSLSQRYFGSLNFSFQLPLEINYTFYQKNKFKALRFCLGLNNRFAIIKYYDNRNFLNNEQNFGETYPKETKEVFDYYTDKIKTLSVIPYAGIKIIGRKSKAFWVNIQYVANSQVPSFEKTTSNYGIVIGFSELISKINQ